MSESGSKHFTVEKPDEPVVNTKGHIIEHTASCGEHPMV